MVVGAPGLTMEAAAKAVGEGQRREQGKRKTICANTYLSLFPGLAQVHHLLAGAQPVLEVLLKPPVATTSAVVNILPLRFFNLKVVYYYQANKKNICFLSNVYLTLLCIICLLQI